MPGRHFAQESSCLKRKKLLTGISKTSWVSSSIWTLMGTCRPGAWPGGRRPGSSVDTPKLSGAPSLCPAVDDLSAGSAMVADISSWAAGTWVHVWWRREELGFISSLLRSFRLPLKAFRLLREKNVFIQFHFSNSHTRLDTHTKTFSQWLCPEHTAVSHSVLNVCNMTAACYRRDQLHSKSNKAPFKTSSDLNQSFTSRWDTVWQH